MINKRLIENCLTKGSISITVNLLECSSNTSAKIGKFTLSKDSIFLYDNELLYIRENFFIPYSCIFCLSCENGENFYYDPNFKAKILAKLNEQESEPFIFKKNNEEALFYKPKYITDL